MSATDPDSDEKFQHMMGTFLNEMVTVYGFRFDEAYAIVYGEIKREYDQRIRDRRASFRLVEASACEIGLKVKK